MVLKRGTAKFTDLKQKLDASNQQQNFKKDERIIVLGKDPKKGSNITFKLLSDSNADSILSYYNHSVFRQSGGFLDVCSSSLEKKCPICEWNSTQDKDDVLNIFSSYRKKKFVWLIYVIDDKYKPENNGKVFFFECGKSVMSQLENELEDISIDDRIIDFSFVLKYTPSQNGGSYSLRLSENKNELDIEIDESKWNLQKYINELPIKDFNILSKKWDSFVIKNFNQN